MKIYTYGIIDSNDGIPESLKGLEESCVYNIPYHDIGIVASNLNGQIQNITKERVLEHEKVIERLMSEFTILPMRFLTVFNRKEDVLFMMKDYYDDFKENLDRLGNKVEFGIKAIWPGEAIRKRIINVYTKGIRNLPMSGNSPAKSFLDKKFGKYLMEKELADEANRYIAVVNHFLNRFAVERKLRRLETENLLLNASYLIEKEKQDDFKEAFKRLRSGAGELKYLFSGPWPPYNFIILTKKRHLLQNFGGADISNKARIGYSDG